MKQELEKLILKYKNYLNTGNAFLKIPEITPEQRKFQRNLNVIWIEILKDLKNLPISNA